MTFHNDSGLPAEISSMSIILYSMYIILVYLMKSSDNQDLLVLEIV